MYISSIENDTHDGYNIIYYRPISLTCVCSKIMESIINENMLVYLLKKGLITEHQHGFLSRRSTCTQLLVSLQDWVVGLSNRKADYVVYIDFSKAFDSVVYSKSLIKLSSHGIKYELLAWLNSFLVGRCQYVSINVFFLNYLWSLVACHRIQFWPHSYFFCISMILLISLISLQLVNFSLMMSNYIATLNSLMILLLVTISIIIWHLPY